MSRRGKSIETEIRMVVAQGLGVEMGEWRVAVDAYGIYFSGDNSVLNLDSGYDGTIL